MMDIFVKYSALIMLVGSHAKMRVVLLSIVVAISALMDVFGIVSIMPFLGAMADPEVVQRNEIIEKIYIFFSDFGFSDPIFLFAIIAMLTLLISSGVKSLTLIFYNKFLYGLEKDLSLIFFKNFLNQEYQYIASKSTNQVTREILSEIESVVSVGVAAIFAFISQSLVILCISAMLILLNPIAFALSGLIVGIILFAVMALSRGYVLRTGIAKVEANKERFSIVAGALNGIKDIKANDIEKMYFDEFQNAATRFSVHQRNISIISHLPRYLVEIIAFGGMFLFLFYSISVTSDLSYVLPIAGVYAFSAYRIIPAAHQVYSSITALRYADAPLTDLLNSIIYLDKDLNEIKEDKNISLTGDLSLHSVGFRFTDEDSFSIDDVSINFQQGTHTAIIGETGSGKSTLLDIIMGLLSANVGELRLDGQALTVENLRSFRRMVGYVPQDVFVAEGTLLDNIVAFCPDAPLDRDLIGRIIDSCQLTELVENTWKDGLETTILERGKSMSGGQRQRVGIARALYKRPKILVLDEATSALDPLTERRLLTALRADYPDVTIISVTHRLETLPSYDNICVLDKGRLIMQGDFNALHDKNERFRSFLG